MPETLEKLRPDRDLQVYFERPSAIAALSGASPSGFTASGTWRQQFDWCVIEWNRDNVFEHPLFRNLPDGDLSGLTLSYEETRENCIPMDSDLYPTVDWPYLRVWADSAGVETFYQVRLKDYATPIEGGYTAATATFELKGTVTAGDIVSLAWLDENYKHDVVASDTLATVAEAIKTSINAGAGNITATRSGNVLTLTCVSRTGANGNVVGAYGTVAGAGSEYWEPAAATFSGGVSPTKWRVVLPLGALTDKDGNAVPTAAMQKVRKMRWTYAAAMQTGAYERSEFQAAVSNWTVTGSNRAYRVAGPGSRRLEDDHKKVSYYGTNWTTTRGNFSGGTIRATATYGESVTIPYHCPQTHELYLGTRLLPTMTPISMPYYDQYTKDQFAATYGFPLRFIGNNTVNPADFPEEAAFLPALIGAFTDGLREYVLASHPNCRFEVLYPTDVNDTDWGHVVNYPNEAWTPAKLTTLKTESFGFTFSRDLNKSKYSVQYGEGKGFARNRRSFLVGPGDSSTTWEKEARIARKQNLESIVLFALDQFCLIGYPVPFWKTQRKGRRF